jgi:hypothetical protein
MYDGGYGGSSMGNFNICHHSSKTTACTYQANEIRQSSIPILDYDTCQSVGLTESRWTTMYADLPPRLPHLDYPT